MRARRGPRLPRRLRLRGTLYHAPWNLYLNQLAEQVDRGLVIYLETVPSHACAWQMMGLCVIGGGRWGPNLLGPQVADFVTAASDHSARTRRVESPGSVAIASASRQR